MFDVRITATCDVCGKQEKKSGVFTRILHLLGNLDHYRMDGFTLDGFSFATSVCIECQEDRKLFDAIEYIREFCCKWYDGCEDCPVYIGIVGDGDDCPLAGCPDLWKNKDERR
jgi:hypothetical protein